ncbi:MAG: hypothetical protein WCG87_04065 [Bacteroidota bacterium]
MKSVTLVILLLLSAMVAVFLHSRKNNTEYKEADQLRKGLSGIAHVLKPHTRINYNESQALEHSHAMSRYLLVSHQVSFCTSPCDTLLTIISLQENDSVLHSLIGSRRILWENKDSIDHYILSCK